MSYLKNLLKYNKYRKQTGHLHQESENKKSMSFDTEIPPLAFHHKEVIIYMKKNLLSGMFIIVLFIIAKHSGEI
jgi:hypothetical protein